MNNWHSGIPKKRFKIMKSIGSIKGCEEIIDQYPEFVSIEEGLQWIRETLDPYITGRYGIVVSDAESKEQSIGTKLTVEISCINFSI